ncbi:phosphatase PAP2 family protein [Larkinella insperata]|uniref:Phosphatase PAP2 family protein n=1 Tax=Larkinella insperata TaxID=332158 RepID=A0ABW3QCZ4_9BACT|nr:phosphatase PAP2 family protein [Larkinella insperata]
MLPQSGWAKWPVYLFFTLLPLLIHPVLAQDSTLVQINPDSSIASQKPYLKGVVQRVGQDGVSAFHTIVKSYARPLHWQKRDFLRLGGALAISAAGLLVEQRLYTFTQQNQTATLDHLERVGFRLGQPQLNYPIMLTLWGSGVLLNNDWLRDTGIMVIASVTTSGLIQTASKEIFGRPRPNTGMGNVALRPFGGPAYHSFPSGHASLATATFWVLAKQVNWVPLKVVFYALPLITGASRIYAGAHWLSDVFLGTALGIAFAESVVRIYPLVKANRKYSLKLAPGPGGIGLLVRY